MDFNDIKDEVKKIETGRSGNPDVIYFEDDTDTYIRLVPMKNIPDELNVGNQFVRAWVHYRSGGVVPNTSFSPRTFGKSDPVEEFVDLELRERVSKKKFKYLMNMKSSEVYITTAVVRGKEQAGTKLLTLTKGQFKDLSKAIEMAFKPEDPEDISDPQNGFDITVQVTGKDNSETNFRTFDWNVNVRNSKPLADSEEEINAFINNQPDWKDAYNRLSVEQLDSYLESSMELGDDDSDLADSSDKEATDYEPSEDISEEDVIAEAEENFENMVNEIEEEEKSEAKAQKETATAVSEESDDDDGDDDMPF